MAGSSFRLAVAATVLGLTASAVLQSADEPASADLELLTRHNVGTDAAGLVRFFASRTLTEADRKQIESWISQLGHEHFTVREEATARLIERGPPALALLRPAMRSADGEIARRAQRCVKEIEAGPGSALTAAALRRLVHLQPPQAVAVLLDFLPFAEDEWVEEEVLAGLGRLTIRGGQVAEELLAAARDSRPARRLAAAYVLGRAGNADQRPLVRTLLDDPDPRVRHQAARGLLPGRFSSGDEDATGDFAILKEAGLAADPAALLRFFRQRTLTEADRKQIEEWLGQLGSERFQEREQACARLVERGPPVLSFLQRAVRHPDPEVSRRAERCIGDIQRGPGPALPMSAARVLARQQPPEAIPVLLHYLPFADDDAVEEEILTALCQLSVKEAKLDPELARSLTASAPASRAASAFVLGHVGGPAECRAVAGLLDDPDPRVRLRAAQGLLAAKDPSAVPALLALVTDAPEEMLWRVEEMLQRLGGDLAPAQTLTETAPAARQKYRDAWAAWWREHAARVDLARLEHGPRYLGLTVIAEMDSNRVWECGRDGAPRWQLNNLLGPIDAQVLPGGRVLVAEHQGQKVTERDLQGKVLWEKAIPGNPVVCQRLPNGNTFIATYNSVLEVRRDGSQAYSYAPNVAPGFPAIYGAQKLRNGHIVVISGNGTLLEMDPSGKQVRTLQVGNNGGWCSVEALPGGRFLIALTNHGKVREIDATGRVLWECSIPGAAHATRLPNGHTLVASMMHRRVVEIDSRGNEVWKQTTTGRPFHAHRR